MSQGVEEICSLCLGIGEVYVGSPGQGDYKGCPLCMEREREALAKRVPSWISVDAELPDSDITVLIYSPEESDPVWLGYHNGEAWHCVEGGLPVHVTHWMHLPEPPASTPHSSH